MTKTKYPINPNKAHNLARHIQAGSYWKAWQSDNFWTRWMYFKDKPGAIMGGISFPTKAITLTRDILYVDDNQCSPPHYICLSVGSDVYWSPISKDTFDFWDNLGRLK